MGKPILKQLSNGRWAVYARGSTVPYVTARTPEDALAEAIMIDSVLSTATRARNEGSADVETLHEAKAVLQRWPDAFTLGRLIGGRYRVYYARKPAHVG